MMDDELPTVTDVFGEVARFHVYDHSRGEWVMNGADFGEVCAIQHEHDEHDGELTEFTSPEVLTEHTSDLTLVWEDGEESGLEEGLIDIQDADAIGTEIADKIAERLDVEPGRVRVVSLEAPNQVSYFTVADGAELTDGGGE